MPKFYKDFTLFLGKFRKKPKDELNALILGLDNAGKTTLLTRLCAENMNSDVRTTTDLTIRHLRFKQTRLCLKELNGHWKARQYWHTHYSDASLLIYVVDSTDVMRLAESRCELCDILMDARMAQVPLLVLANKQDVRGALPCSLVVDMMGLNRLEGRNWTILCCSAVNGDNISIIYHWFYKNLKVMHPQSGIKQFMRPGLLFGSTCSLDFQHH